ncbi:MAG: DUF922 domain-containing Zn-dependent protease [Rhodanobacteraceae bacterium]
MKTLVVLLMMAATFGGNVLASDPTISLRIKYYDVSGSTGREIRNQLDKLGPVGADGKRYDGYTRWRVNWNFQFAPKGGHCALRSFKTSVRTVMTLPRWEGSRNVSSRLAKKWNTYLAALRLHEDGHNHHGVEAAEAILKRFSEMQQAPDCEKLSHDLNAAARSILASYNQKDLIYDAKTHHGATQGAVFPP